MASDGMKTSPPPMVTVSDEEPVLGVVPGLILLLIRVAVSWDSFRESRKASV